MKKSRVAKLEPGIYRIKWKLGAQSMVAVGNDINGNKWLADVDCLLGSTTEREVWKQVGQAHRVLFGHCGAKESKRVKIEDKENE